MGCEMTISWFFQAQISENKNYFHVIPLLQLQIGVSEMLSKLFRSNIVQVGCRLYTELLMCC